MRLIFETVTVEIIFFILLLILLGVGYENYNYTDRNFFEVTTTPNYDDVAELEFIYNLNFWDFYFSPVLGSHNDSFIGITLLDTFGDYFDIYWNNDSSLFFKNRQDVLLVQESYNLLAPKINFTNKTITINAQRLTDIYLTSSIGIFLSIIFYIQIFKNLFITRRKFN